jgi:hypothetical protein
MKRPVLFSLLIWVRISLGEVWAKIECRSALGFYSRGLKLQNSMNVTVCHRNLSNITKATCIYRKLRIVLMPYSSFNTTNCARGYSDDMKSVCLLWLWRRMLAVRNDNTQFLLSFHRNLVPRGLFRTLHTPRDWVDQYLVPTLDDETST